MKPAPTVLPTPAATPYATSADEAGARAFVFAYYKEWDRALATGDTTRMATYQLPTCTCVAAVKDIENTYKAGGRIMGARFTLLDWAFGAHGPAYARTATAFSASGATYKVPGKRDVAERRIYAKHFIDLRRVGGHWAISAIRFKEVQAP